MLTAFSQIFFNLIFLSLGFTSFSLADTEPLNIVPKRESFCGDSDIQIDNFRTVTFRGILPQAKYECNEQTKNAQRLVSRGGRLRDGNLTEARELLAMGVKTVLNLEGEGVAGVEKTLVEGVYEREQDNLPLPSRIKLNYVDITFNGFNAPVVENLKKVLDVLINLENYPIYIHCKRGIDRTGFVVALVRVLEGWSAAAANDEWNSYRDTASRIFSSDVFTGGKPYVQALEGRKLEEIKSAMDQVGNRVTQIVLRKTRDRK